MSADVTFMRTPAETLLGEQFRALQALASDPRSGVRQAAFERFEAAGLPHRRIEAWHYTDLRSLWREAFQPCVPPADVALDEVRVRLAQLPEEPGGRRAVMVDGIFQPALSSLGTLPPGVAVGPADAVGTDAATEALGAAESIVALNAAFARGGLGITLDGGAVLPEPLHIVFIVTGQSPTATATRSFVRLGEHASATVVERHVRTTAVASQDNHVLVISLGDGAAMDHVAHLEDRSTGSLHLGTTLARLGADARFTSFTLAASGGVVRRQTFLEFAGQHSAASLNGVSLLEGRAHADTTLVVTHKAAHCESREYFKTILAGESTGVYQGKVIVAPGAQKTDGKMLSKAIFLSDGPSMFNKPELEIFADDVVCGHGATVGYLDEDQLFYLRSRGIPVKEAQSILLNAFAADAIESVGDEPTRDSLRGSVQTWLAKRQS